MTLLDIAADAYVVSPSAVDAAAPFVAVAGLLILLVLGVRELRECPRGRRRS